MAFSKNLWLFYKSNLNNYENLKKTKQILSEAWKISVRKEAKAEISRYFCEKTNKINNFEVWRQKLVKYPLIRQFYFNILNFWWGIWSKRASFGLVILTVCPYKSWNWKFWRLDFWNWNLNKPLSRLFFKRKNIFSSSRPSKNVLVSGQNKKIEKLIVRFDSKILKQSSHIKRKIQK